ncbi:DNA-directed RNA polymerases I and III subunit RPAC2-like protein [Hyaloraphidium curvatum]|nr:DNA-directed RNA polymerases I and III subunit RPAC2-like protein [Hyaloraphidium curvatum]
MADYKSPIKPMATEEPKLVVLNGAYEDPGCATFTLNEEDHTLGNSLRYMIMKNPKTDYCGYSNPHPSEDKINLRIQTDGSCPATDVLSKGLDDLMDLCDHVLETFDAAVASRRSSSRAKK